MICPGKIKSATCVLLLTLAFPALAQDSTSIRLGGSGVSIGTNDEGTEYFELDFNNTVSDRKVKTKWGLLDIGVNVAEVNADSALTGFEDLRYGRSLNVEMHLFKQRISLVKRKFNFEYGLTFSWNNYSFQNDIILLPNRDYYTIAEAEEPLKKSRLSSTYLTIPVMLNLETNPDNRWKSFRFSAGVTGGLRIASKTKIRTDTRSKIKQRDDFNLNRWQYGPTARIGYGWVNFYGKYNMPSLFEDGQGPEVNTWTVGLSIRTF